MRIQYSNNMKKRFFLLAIVSFMAQMLVNSQNSALQSSATQVSTATIYTTDNVKGDYAGRLDKMEMNGKKKNPVENRTITVKANGTSKIDISLPPFKAGSMPGTIGINAQGIVLNADGTFSANNLENAVTVKIGIITKKYKAARVSGRFIQRPTGGYNLEFGLDSEGTVMLVSSIKVYVHFAGSK